jgi:hypothetical protein
MKSVFYFFVFATIIFTGRNGIAFFANRPLYFREVNIACLYVCGVIMIGNAFYLLVTIPSAFRQTHHPKKLGHAVQLTMSLGGAEALTRRGGWFFMFAIVAFILVFCMSHAK